MHTLQARQAKVTEFPQLVEWMHANRGANRYDPDIFTYRSVRTLAVDQDDEPILYLPYMLTITTESLAPKPGASKREIAIGLREAIHQVVRIAKKSGIDEIYFMASDQETVDFAKKHGYEELPFRPMRLKTKNLTPPLPEDKE
jgi:hypothetical protein